MASPRGSPRVEAAKARCADGPVSPKAAAAAAAAAANAAAALAAGCSDTSSEWQAILAEVSKAVVVLKVRSRARSPRVVRPSQQKRSPRCRGPWHAARARRADLPRQPPAARGAGLADAPRRLLPHQMTSTKSFDTEVASSGYATGFVVDAERGLILTNRHGEI